MKITDIFSCLAPPRDEDEEDEKIKGAVIPLSGNLHKMLAEVFAKSETECEIPIRFKRGVDGKQQNEVRDEILQLIQKPSLAMAEVLAERLRFCTTHRSGLGLMFLMCGSDGPEHKIVISRFPADQGVVAETHAGSLDIHFVGQVFMKNAASYKAATYRDKINKSSFWNGAVVDKQLKYASHLAANYWVDHFLISEPMTTPKAGSMRVAQALRSAAAGSESVDIQDEIISAAKLMKGLSGKLVSPLDIFEQFGLSDEAREQVRKQFPNPSMLTDPFVLDGEEFSRHAAFQSVRLDTGGILTAPAEDFDEVFHRQKIADDRVRYTTEGQIVDEKLKRRA